jgi:large subunit ribosomal protein L24
MKLIKNLHVKVGDRVKVISGNQKGLIGVITSILREKSTVTIDSIEPRIRYKKNQQVGESRKTELQIPINISNVMLWDTTANISSRIGYKIIENKKQRYFKKSGNLV